jgi:hypothetical protein
LSIEQSGFSGEPIREDARLKISTSHGTTYDAALHVLYVVESALFHAHITEEAMHDRFETFGPRGDR